MEAPMQQRFDRALIGLENAFRQLEKKVPPPVRKTWSGGFVFRYAEQTIQQAIVQKLARLVSGLHAVSTLLERGLFQEQGMMQRAVDELDEDITFLSLGVMRNEITSQHLEYLEYFYAEEFDDPEDVVSSHQRRGMMRREKIRAYNFSATLSPKDAARAKIVGKVLTKAYSGFIHAASPHIMDMCGGAPPRFDINGSWKSFRYSEHASDAQNVFYRAIVAMAYAAKALGDDGLFSAMHKLQQEFYEEMYGGGRQSRE